MLRARSKVTERPSATGRTAFSAAAMSLLTPARGRLGAGLAANPTKLGGLDVNRPLDNIDYNELIRLSVRKLR
ncbi:hypothetical protein GCM10011578_017470 [Streptomyces fuscichromogenes]|uniref:Uncharacterized protein n=1 Tax=Streptomyces fuscichromogenes TaxID=1324013 RepID=A0A917UII1_9ACTN|nr:hypothetical protein GCM10011578_017470 [Streptomyces fuscichromogenes]